MKKYPIDFKRREIRVILAGKKTQIRIPISEIKCSKGWRFGQLKDNFGYLSRDDSFIWAEFFYTNPRNGVEIIDLARFPYGRPGNILWIRELWPIGNLLIVGVTVERLQSIQKKDCYAEGIECDSKDPYKESQKRWVSIFGKKAWKKNPWVWVIDFKLKERC